MTTTIRRTRTPRRPPSVSSEDCTPDQLETVAPDTLTIATDDPAFPPYFEDNDPTNGEGFESAVAYAVADELGFSEDQVEWVVEPFNRSYAPGEKDYDFDINQISITPKRAEAVDFSSPVLRGEAGRRGAEGLARSPTPSSLAEVADAEIGAQIGTTSLDAIEAVIQPTSDPQVFDTSNDVVSALKNGQVEAVVVDVPTAFYPDRGAGDGRADRRPVRGPRGRRVRPPPREGLAAHRRACRRRSTPQRIR